MARKRDVQQFRQACQEARLTRDQRYEATKAFHAEKRATRSRDDMTYVELLEWLREWRETHGDD